MTPASLLDAAASAGLFLGCGGVVSRSVKRMFFPDWRGSPAVVVVALTGLGWALVVGQLLGAVGGLRTAPLLGAALVSAAIALVADRRVGAPEPEAPAVVRSPPPPALLVATVVLVLVLAAVWTASTVLTLRRGVYDPDSVAYHLPFTARFAQTGFADPTGFQFPTAPIQFFPANDELLAAIALVLTKSMAFVVVKNLLYGGLVLVAAHAVGQAFDAGLLAVSGMAVALGVPAVAFTQPGEAMNDTLPLFALVGGLAVLAHARSRGAPYVLALAAAGMAYGTKYSAIVPAIAVGLLALWLVRTRTTAHRLGTAGLGALASLAVGGSWYLRNAITFGSPVPATRLALGPLHLRQVTTQAAEDSYSVAWYLVRGRALGQLWDGLGQGLGPLFLPVLGALAVGTVAALVGGGGGRHTGMGRGLAAVAIVTTLGYLTLPGSAYGGDGTPGPGFVTNLHYALPALAFGALAAAVTLGHRRRAWLVPAVGVLVVLSGVEPGQRKQTWSPGIAGGGLALLLAAAAAGGIVSFLTTRRPVNRRPVNRVAPGRAPANDTTTPPSTQTPAAGAGRAVGYGAATAATLALVGMVALFRQEPSLAEADPAQRWAASVAPTTIGGWVPASALLFGPGARNRVVHLTRDRFVDGGPVALDSCLDWMGAVTAGRFPYVGVIPDTQWQRWTAADPAFVPVVDNGPGAFYRIAVYQVIASPDLTCGQRR